MFLIRDFGNDVHTFALTFCSMKRTLSRYNKCLDSPEAALVEYRAEVLCRTCLDSYVFVPCGIYIQMKSL